jgi:hypothetical protein
MCLYSNLLVAGVYHCINQSGIREFSDRPCLERSKKQVFLPYIYKRTSNKKESRFQKKETAKTIKQAAIIERKQARMNAKVQKQLQKEALKKTRLQERCTRTQERVKIIESQLRLGCSLRRCQRLQQDLSHTLVMKNRYCDNG